MKRIRFKAKLSQRRILAWADAHYARTGRWPRIASGRVREEPEETWSRIDAALSRGWRGLPGGSSLARFLTQHRGVRNRRGLPALSVEGILSWADDHHRRTGEWPALRSGPVYAAPGETWRAVHSALCCGRRGLPGDSSLARLLAERRGKRNRKALPKLTYKQILAWADAHHEHTGNWPRVLPGPVHGAPGETWTRIESSLRIGGRGLPGGCTLAQLLAKHRGVRYRRHVPPLTVTQILVWAEEHYQRMGDWPTSKSGPVHGTRGETWMALAAALRAGGRGLRGRGTLAQLIARRYGGRARKTPPRQDGTRTPSQSGRPGRSAAPPLTLDQILAWADRYHAQTGSWPKKTSRPVYGAPRGTWSAISAALAQGLRGLPGGSSLAQLLATHRGVTNPKNLPRLTIRRILAWADAHHRHTGAWPTQNSGPLNDVPGERWRAINEALRLGCRGLPGGSSLAQLLESRRGVPIRSKAPRLTIGRILAWADRYYANTGSWPKTHSRPVYGAPRETWMGIDTALKQGVRGLPGGSSLIQVLAEHRGVRNPKDLPPVTIRQILAWADTHRQRTKTWPRANTGAVHGVPGERWSALDSALRYGARGLPAKWTLSRLLNRYRGVRRYARQPNAGRTVRP